MKYYKKIEGEKLYLSPLCMEDAQTYTRWMNDPQVSENLGNANLILGLEAEKKALAVLAEGYNFSIILKENDTLLGNIGLLSINQLHRRGELGVFIGEESHRGKGYGEQAISLFLWFLFHTLQFHSVTLRVFAGNKGAIACYKKAGFQEIGRQREAHFRYGRFEDIVHMDILSTQWKQ